MSTFLLLLGFALFKVAVGLALVYLGLRGSGRDDPDDGFGQPEPPRPPHRPTPRPRPRRRALRGHPRRTPVRSQARRVRAGR